MKIISTILPLIFVLVLSACGGSGSNPTTTPVVVSSSSSSSSSSYKYLGKIQADLSVTSTITGIAYPYHVYLPHNYEISGKTYPVIYETDAQWNFPYFTQIIDFRNKDVIFVGIEEGPRNSNRREVDFLPTGAPAYINFSKNEFIPIIEKNYRTNGERTYVGASYGGLLGAILLSKEPEGEPYFKNYLLFDGSFGVMQAMNIQDEIDRFNANHALNVNLILTSANPGNLLMVDTYQSRIENRQYEGIRIYRRFYNVPHLEISNPSFYDTIDLLY